MVTRWERVFLCQLFIMLITHIKELYRDSSNNESVEADWRKTIMYKTCQMLGNKVCFFLQKTKDN